MAELIWDASGERFYEIGVEKGVHYPKATDGTYPMGYAWNGLSNVTESPEGGETSKVYADNIPYLTLSSTEDFGGSIEAYTYPDSFEESQGVEELQADSGVSVTGQTRKPFGFCYKTLIGNDTESTAYGYKIHLVYDAVVTPTEKSNDTVGEDPEAVAMSWDFTTTPIVVPGMKPTAHLVIDSTKIEAADLTTIEEALYGTGATEPHLLTPTEVLAIIAA